MKLPSRVRTGVQPIRSQGIQSAMAPAQATARALGTLSGVLDQSYAKYQQDKTESQVRQAGLAMSDQMVSFEERYGNRDFFTPDEIPDNIEVRRTEQVVNDDGTISEVQRTNIPAYEVYPQMYRSFAENYSKAASSQIDDSGAREGWSVSTEQTINNQYLGKLTNAKNQQDQFLAEQLAAQISDAASKGNWDIARSLAGDIKNENLRSATMKGLDFQQEDTQYNQLALLNPADVGVRQQLTEAASELRDLSAESNLTEQQRMAKANLLESRIALGVASESASAERDRQETVSDTWLGIDVLDPKVDEAYVQDLFDRETIDGGTRTAMIRALRRNREQLIADEAVKYDLDSIAASPYGVDPKDKDARAQVSERYEEYLEQQIQPLQASERIMSEFHIVPDQVQSVFRASNRADAPGLAQAVVMWQQASRHAPLALRDFKDGEIDVIQSVAAYLDQGMRPDDAIAAVRNWETLSPEHKQVLKDTIKSPDFRDDNADVLQSMMDEHNGYRWYNALWTDSADVDDVMKARFNASVERYLPLSMWDTKIAQRKAFTDLMKSYSMTDVNGKAQYMQYPPQAPTENIRSWVRAQYKGQLSVGQKFDNIQLGSDALTVMQIEAGQKPTYPAFIVVDEDTIEFLPRFEWDADAAAKERRSEILRKAEEERETVIRRQEFMERIRAAEGVG